jgi:hypothetical protein
MKLAIVDFGSQGALERARAWRLKTGSLKKKI